MRAHAGWWAPALVLVAGACGLGPGASRAADVPAARGGLTAAYLESGTRAKEVDLSAFAPPADATAPTQTFEGTLKLSGKVQTRTILTVPGFLSAAQLAASRTFPTDFDYEFAQNEDVLLPVRRGYIVTDHPLWDFVLQPGRVWNEPGDGGFTRAALPFELIQKFMNCTHYGVLSFLFKADGEISHVAMQVSSETCGYHKFDMWALFTASYRPHPVADKAAVIAQHEQAVRARLPTRPIAQLAKDYSGADPARLAIGDSGSRALYGLAFHGVNYVSDCPTRHGDYPYCAELAFPSYSTAKTAVAALALMAMEQVHPGTGKRRVPDFAPAEGCRDPSWDGVTLRDLLDMASGHYDSADYMADEDAPKVQGFFYAVTEPRMAAFSCSAYPRRSAPGTTWVYHTSDTFLLGDELTRYFRSLPGERDADVFRDVVVAKIYAPLDLSAVARVSRRTPDAAAQPFFGYGLQFTRDDIVRLATFIASGDGKLDGRQVLDPKLLDLALQKVDGQRGLVVQAFPDFRYQLGFWARNVAPLVGCARPEWVPFMSGHGGISVVMYPNGVVYYSVSDAGSPAAFDWGPSAAVASVVGGSLCR